jgi:heme A synthase
VAGLDAGHAYNTFPLMGGRVVPEEYAALPGWRNAFENTAAVQFHHRCTPKHSSFQLAFGVDFAGCNSRKLFCYLTL